jgi:quercetin 2,3-dioxygenase
MSTFRVVRSGERDLWRDAALTSRQSFPATGNFDLAANAFGLLMVHNDDVVAPGEGFDMHQHDNVEIVTWVVEGRLRHRDSGAEGVTELGAGSAQHISAGSGVRHSEVNAAGYTSRSPVRVVQSWLPADIPDTTPFHASHDFNEELDRGGLVQVAGPDSPLPLGTAGAALYAARLTSEVTVPAGGCVHLYVIDGQVEAAGHRLGEGDALRATDTGELTVNGAAEILVWVMSRGI